MARVRVEYHEEGMRQLMHDTGMKQMLVGLAEKVKSAAEATASDAEEGPGGTIDGYAAAGFSVVYEERTRRPRVLIQSNADPELAMAVYWHTQQRDGVVHLRKALKDGVS